MEDIKSLLNVMVQDTLKPEDREYLETLQNDNNQKAIDVFMANKYYFLDRDFRIEALREELKKKYRNYYRTLIETENVAELLPTLKKIKEMEELQPDIKKSDIMFITLAPPENEINNDNFIKKTLEFCEFKYIKQYLFVIEQRFNGTPNEKYKKLGDGSHIHILFDKGNHKPSDIKRDIKRKFAGYTMIMDFSYRHRRDLLKTQGYMVGLKKDHDKQLKQQQDSIWRKKEGYRNYYGTLWNDLNDS
jgi:CRISPR/Cas system endoribonuclease Cas6 (RAMP superfamily)